MPVTGNQFVKVAKKRAKEAYCTHARNGGTAQSRDNPSGKDALATELFKHSLIQVVAASSHGTSFTVVQAKICFDFRALRGGALSSYTILEYLAPFRCSPSTWILLCRLRDWM